MFEEGINPLSPSNFFDIECTLPYIKPAKWKEEIVKKGYLLCDTSWLLAESRHLNLHVGWSEEGLYLYVHVEGSFDEPSFPNLLEGDSFELFLDTRNRKSSSFNNKFCHHFYFLPQAIEGHIKGEITRFRTEDAHPLADADEIYLEAKSSSKEGKLKIFIPAPLLVGWSPLEFPKLGFSFRLNRKGLEPEHFSAKTSEYAIEQEPSLWATCLLKNPH